jgi:hypothetical protein
MFGVKDSVKIATGVPEGGPRFALFRGHDFTPGAPRTVSCRLRFLLRLLLASRLQVPSGSMPAKIPLKVLRSLFDAVYNTLIFVL